MNLTRKPIFWIVLIAALLTGSLFLVEDEPVTGNWFQNVLNVMPTIIVLTAIFTGVLYGFYSWGVELVEANREAGRKK